jgi:fluoroacetyl-CoA thioesterase
MDARVDRMQMNLVDKLTVGLSAELRLVVAKEMTIGHLVADMPLVYATPIMILHMEMAAGSAIASLLPSGFVSVGTAVDVRHLAATPVGGKVHVIASMTEVGTRSVTFETEAWNEVRKIGEGTHSRAIVNVKEFERRFGVRDSALA